MNTRLRRVFPIGALALAALFPGAAAANPIIKAVTIRVFEICDDSDCPSTGPAGDVYFAAETDAIWSQAGIDVQFDFVAQIMSEAFSDINDGSSGHTFAELAAAYGSHGAAVDMYLVDTVAGAYGESAPAYGMVIGMDTVMAFHDGLGRLDTIAHELGHDLGLVNPSDPAYNPSDHGHSIYPNQLMASGGIRNEPWTLADITTGDSYDQLSQRQITDALGSPFLDAVPEPASMALFGSGILALVLIRRRRRRAFSQPVASRGKGVFGQPFRRLADGR